MPPTHRPRVYGKRKEPGPTGYAVSSIFSSTSPTKPRPRATSPPHPPASALPAPTAPALAPPSTSSRNRTSVEEVPKPHLRQKHADELDHNQERNAELNSGTESEPDDGLLDWENVSDGAEMEDVGPKGVGEARKSRICSSNSPRLANGLKTAGAETKTGIESSSPSVDSLQKRVDQLNISEGWRKVSIQDCNEEEREEKKEGNKEAKRGAQKGTATKKVVKGARKEAKKQPKEGSAEEFRADCYKEDEWFRKGGPPPAPKTASRLMPSMQEKAARDRSEANDRAREQAPSGPPRSHPPQQHSQLSHRSHHNPPPESYFSRLLRQCVSRSARRAPLPFDAWADSVDRHFTVRKIAEASFGEVFRLCVRDRAGTGLTRADESVIKILAVRPPEVDRVTEAGRDPKTDKYRYDLMSDPAGIESEIELLKLLSPVPGFANFRDLRLVRGRPAPSFARAWRAWNDRQAESDKSVFPAWDGADNYPDDQVWAIIEMQDAGPDLDAFVLRDVWAVWDVFWGVVLAVAKAEGTLGFEHRDMHLGNICANVKGFLPRSASAAGEGGSLGADAEGEMFAKETVELLTTLSEPPIRISSHALGLAHTSKNDGSTTNNPVGGKAHSPPARTKLHFTDLVPTIIDYTISRAELGSPEKRNKARREGGEEGRDRDPELENPPVAFIDLSQDADIFAGDASVHYQYEMYRCMRSAAFLDDPLAKYPPPRTARANGARKRTAPGSRTKGAKAGVGEQEEENGSGEDGDQPARTWRGFHPQTNVVWLHFILHELMAPLGPLNLSADVAEFEARRRRGGTTDGRKDADKLQDAKKDGDEDEEGEADEEGEDKEEEEEEEEPRRKPRRLAAAAAADALKRSTAAAAAKPGRKRNGHKTGVSGGGESPLARDPDRHSSDTTAERKARDERFGTLLSRISILDPAGSDPGDRPDRAVDPSSDPGLADRVLGHGQYLEYSLSRVGQLLSLRRWSEHVRKRKTKTKTKTKGKGKGEGSAAAVPGPAKGLTGRSRLRRESTAAVGLDGGVEDRDGDGDGDGDGLVDVDEHGPILRSAGDLVAVALREGWLDERDVVLAQ